MNNKIQLEIKIRSLKQQLNSLIEKEEYIQSKELLDLSTKLDDLLNKWFKAASS